MMKFCSSCNIKKDYIFFVKEKRNKDGLSNKCKQCKNNKRNLERSLIPDKIREQERSYKSKNKNKVAEWVAKCKAKNPEKYKLHREKYQNRNAKIILERSRICSEKSAKNISDNYVKGILVKLKFKKEHLTPKIIELKRILIKNKRLCKTLMNS